MTTRPQPPAEFSADGCRPGKECVEGLVVSNWKFSISKCTIENIKATDETQERRPVMLGQMPFTRHQLAIVKAADAYRTEKSRSSALRGLFSR